ncbi:MAG: hypothetical protein ACI9YU_002054 [Flavobacteriales bacterium]|jgi:hypothetical protein
MRAVLSFTFLLISLVAHSQCTVSTTGNVAGVYPNPMDMGCTNNYYDEVIDIIVPLDTTFLSPFGLITVPYDSVVIVAINNLPAGLSYTCGNIQCTAYPSGGTISPRICINIFGTPTSAPANSTLSIMLVRLCALTSCDSDCKSIKKSVTKVSSVEFVAKFV